MDRKLKAFLPTRGFFVEVGANDGFRQSNTYWLERFGGWRGLLVEPVPDLARRCAAERPASRVVNCALGATDTPQEVTIHVGGLVSKVVDAGQQRNQPDEDFGEPFTRTGWVTVPLRTLSSLLDEMGSPEVDFFSLDVEGYEPQVLAGLEPRHRPRFLLLECNTPLEPDGFEPVAHLSHRDILFRRRDG